MAPKDENELARMMATALAINGPVAIRYPRGEGVGVPMDPFPLPLPVGEAEQLKPPTEEGVFLALGSMVQPALAAAALLEKEGCPVGVVNARFAKPIDRKMLVSIAKHCRSIITLEEHLLSGGFGESVLSCLEEETAHGNIEPVRLLSLGITDQFIEHGSQSLLRKQAGLDPRSIADRALSFFKLNVAR
jgi:1-deoxy-D-xylulose-5-phosphate synthase